MERVRKGTEIRQRRTTSAAVPFILFCAATTLACLSGCGPERTERPQTELQQRPAMISEVVSIGDSTVLGVKLLQSNGRAIGYYFRAESGIVACPHSDINTMGGAMIPAATAKNWSEHDFQGQLDEKILKVNFPAKALGVEPGMTVREALGLMNKQNAPARR